MASLLIFFLMALAVTLWSQTAQAEAKSEKKEEAKTESNEAAPPTAGGVEGELQSSFKMEPMVVNIPDKNTIHYLKFQIELATSTPETVEEIKGKLSKFKDALLMLTSDKSLRSIMTAAGKNLLKEDVADSFNKILVKGEVKDLYFTEFTVQ
jgi:flagellar FliL protein